MWKIRVLFKCSHLLYFHFLSFVLVAVFAAVAFQWNSMNFPKRKQIRKNIEQEKGKTVDEKNSSNVEFCSTKEWSSSFFAVQWEKIIDEFVLFSSHHCLHSLCINTYVRVCESVCVSSLIWKANRWIIALAQCCYI